MSAKIKILFCSSEVVPFAKTGGLADVAGTLPLALEELGVETRIVMPHYAAIDSERFKLKRLDNQTSVAKLGKKVRVYFIENADYFNRSGLYQDKGVDYADNLPRFAYYCVQTLELIKRIKFKPDVIHCNDWQTALIPIYLKTRYNHDPFYKKIKTVFTIHNLGYQGLCPKEQFPATGLNPDLFTVDGVEFYGKVNLLKGGLLFADKITTVSPTYAKEIQTPEFGCGLEGVLQKRRHDTSGILNGIDYQEWDPAKNESLVKNYSIDDPGSKYANKLDLQKISGLKQNIDVPLLGMITRLADQKGLDIFCEAIDKICQLPLQFILLGTGDQKYHSLFEKVKKKYKNTSINLKFDAVLAYKIYAGSDMFLMPSYYEPCGLGQLISLKFGTIPVVRKTGGLADTVTDYNVSGGAPGNGFVFTEYKSQKLFKAVKTALDVYADKKAWRDLVAVAMNCNFAWAESAKKYVELYKSLPIEK